VLLLVLLLVLGVLVLEVLFIRRAAWIGVTFGLVDVGDKLFGEEDDEVEGRGGREESEDVFEGVGRGVGGGCVAAEVEIRPGFGFEGPACLATATGEFVGVGLGCAARVEEEKVLALGLAGEGRVGLDDWLVCQLGSDTVIM